MSILGMLLAFLLYSFFFKKLYFFKVSQLGRKFYIFFNKKWFFDKFYNEFFIQFFLNLGYLGTYRTIDRGIIEMVGPLGLSTLAFANSKVLAKFQTGNIFEYTF